MPSSKLKRKALLLFCLLLILLNPLISFAADANQLANEFYNALTTKFPFEKPSNISKCISDYVAGNESGNCAVLTYCVYNDYQGLNLKSSEYCTNYCVNTFLTPSATLFYNYIKQGKFKEIGDLILNIKSSTITNPDPSRPDIKYTNTACSQANHASGFLNTFGLLGKVNKLDDVQNILNGLGIISPTTCYDSTFYSRMKELLSNYPFNLTQYQKCDLNNITKECLYNTASALEKDKNVAPLNPYNDPGRAIDIQNLADAIRRFADCPNETNLAAIASTHFAAIVGETTLQPSPDENNCLIEFVGIGFWDFVRYLIAPWSEISKTVIRLFAAIALGMRAITGYIANAFVWAFTGLPQKLGGYIHFKPIYDYDPITNTKSGIWTVVLAYANLGIIIGMIFMAIATILRIEKYSWKKMLWKILLVALLVNFSLVILGIFVDISNFFSVYFLSQGTNNNLGDTIKNVITSVSCPLAGDKTHFVPDMTAVTVAIILSGIFLFQFAGLLFYVASRIITIWICVATAPFAFLGMAIDVEPIKKAVDLWRDRFTQAIVSLPILSFALYFVLVILSSIGTQLNEIANGNDPLGFVMLMAYAAVIILLAQVLRFVAKSIGIEQIEQGYAFAKKAVTGAVMAGTAAVGGFALGRVVNSGWYNNLAENLSGKEGKLGSKRFVGVPLRGISTQLYNFKGMVASSQEKKEEKELEAISGEKNALTNYVISARRLGKTTSALKALKIKADKEFEYTDTERQFMLQLPERFRGTEEARRIYKYNPALRIDKETGKPITAEQTAIRYNLSAPGEVNVKEVIETLGAEAKNFLANDNYGVLKTASTIKQIAKFIQGIPVSDLKKTLQTISSNVLGTPKATVSLYDWLKDNNQKIEVKIENPPVGGRESDLAAIIKQVWETKEKNIP